MLASFRSFKLFELSTQAATGKCSVERPCFLLKHTMYNLSATNKPSKAFQGFRVSGLQCFRVAGNLGVRVSGFQGFRVSGFQGFRDSGIQGFRDSGFQGFRVSGIQGFRVWGLGFRVRA